MRAPKKRRNIPLQSAAWLRLRAQVLAEEPLCRMCAARGDVVPATDVDHIVNGEGDYTDDNSRENLQPLCHECHSRKTAADMGKRASLGFDADGWPLDPSHPWNQSASAEESPATGPALTAPEVFIYR